MKANATTTIRRDGRLRDVVVNDMKVSPLAQREVNPAWVDHLSANLDLDQLGNPVLSLRDGTHWIIDGQHRIEALKAFGLGDSTIQSWVYEGLTEQQEAERFLKHNNVKAIRAIDKYHVAITAQRGVECDIDRIVRARGLVVTKDKVDGGISAVGTLVRIYQRSGAKTLARTLKVTHGAFGDPGLEASVLDGIGLLCQRYNGALDDTVAIEKLGKISAGVNGFMGKAETIRKATRNAKAHCVAAAAVEVINSGRGGKKLDAWFQV